MSNDVIIWLRKKPVAVRAVRWTGSNVSDVRRLTGPDRFRLVSPEDRKDPEITAEVWDILHSTWVGVKDGQWVMEGVRGENYPCDDDVIRLTYEPAEEHP